MNKILEEYRKTLKKDTTLGDVVDKFDIHFIDYPLNIPIKNAMQTIVCSKLGIPKKEIIYMFDDNYHHKSEDKCNNGNTSNRDILSFMNLSERFRKDEEGEKDDKSIDFFTCRGKYICVDFKSLYMGIYNNYVLYTGYINEENKKEQYKKLINAIYDYRKRNNIFLFFLSADMTNYHIYTFLNEITKYKINYMFYNFNPFGSNDLPKVQYNSNNKNIRMTINQWASINEKIGTDASTLKANFDLPPPPNEVGDILVKAFYCRFLNIRYSPEVENLIENANLNKKKLDLHTIVEVLGLQNVKKNYAPKIDKMIEFINSNLDNKHLIFTLFDDYYKSDDIFSPENKFRDFSDYGIKLLKECFKNINQMLENDKAEKIKYFVLDSKIEEYKDKIKVIEEFNKEKNSVLISSETDSKTYKKVEGVKYFHILDIGIDYAYDIFLNILIKSRENPDIQVILWTVTNPDESYSLDQFFKDQFYIFVNKCNEDYLERISNSIKINMLHDLKLS